MTSEEHEHDKDEDCSCKSDAKEQDCCCDDDEHDHEHDEDCDCDDKEHHHHHEHEHDEDCDCDNHEHDQDCDCDDKEHHHDHDHEHQHKELANGEIEVNLHEEGSIIASGSLKLVGVDAEEVSQKLACGLQAVAHKVDDAGGMIGHLKATLAKTETRMLTTTLAETDVFVKLSPQAEVLVNLVLIVFLVDVEDLQQWGQELMASLY